MGASRPLISFIVITYNQELYIRKALEGAFSQTYSPLEIIISDDNSKDETCRVAEEMIALYKGPHKIILNKNTENMGIGKHINHVMDLCSGEIIIASAGDDISFPERTERIFREFEDSGGKAMSVWSNAVVIDEEDREMTYINRSSNLLETLPEPVRECKHLFNNPLDPSCYLPENIVKGDYILHGCTHAWRRDVFDKFGHLRVPLTYEDKVIPFRSALLGGIRYIDEVLVKYRQHSNNITNIRISTRQQYRFLLELDSVYNNWLQDLDTFERNKLSENEKIPEIRKTVEERIENLLENISLFRASWFRRLIIILKSLANGAQWSSVRNRIGIFLMPAVYDKYIDLRYNKRKGKNA